jgi:predicted membrane chloride channel (bestrophin family)
MYENLARQIWVCGNEMEYEDEKQNCNIIFISSICGSDKMHLRGEQVSELEELMPDTHGTQN